MAMARSFVGRSRELQLLDELYASDKAEFLILYGRRRVGKTTLMREWLASRGISAVAFVATQDTKESHLRQFSQAVYARAFPGRPVSPSFTFADWDQAWDQLAALAQKERLVVFIDEFTYMMASDPSIASNLQRGWDAQLENANIFLCISGSHLGMMVKGVLSAQAPLFGRSTAKMQLQPLPFGVTSSYFPQYTAVDRVALYAVFGGVPHYWRMIDQRRSVSDNIKRLLLSQAAMLRDEPRLLLSDYISDTRNYVAILAAIAGGAHTPKEIEAISGIQNVHLSQYLANLSDTGFIRKDVPVTAAPNARSGRHVITDPFIRFYYRFIHARQTQYEMGEADQALQELQRHMPDYIGAYTWEELCREWTLRAGSRGFLPLSPDYVGSDWGKAYQVDVVGINSMKKRLILGECKWLRERGKVEPLKLLVEQKAPKVIPAAGQWQVYFVGFSREGWNEHAVAYAQQIEANPPAGENWVSTGLRLIDLARVDADLQAWA